jgi:acetate kinase
MAVDESRNASLIGTEGAFHGDGSRVELWTIPTDEELLIARDTAALVA